MAEHEVWQRLDMRAALAVRDMAFVFKLLQKHGVSQRRIAALTGQSQSEISEILAGRRVVSYYVLSRIADGLGIPRGRLGLAYDDPTKLLIARTPWIAGKIDAMMRGERSSILPAVVPSLGDQLLLVRDATDEDGRVQLHVIATGDPADDAEVPAADAAGPVVGGSDG